MPSDSVFDVAAEALERSTTLDRLEARGTLRLALKQAGFDPKTIRVSEIRTVIERILPDELAARAFDEFGS